MTASPTDPAVKNSKGISSLCAVSHLSTRVNIPPISHDPFSDLSLITNLFSVDCIKSQKVKKFSNP